MCGVAMTCGMAKRGLSGAGGSWAKTSKAAPLRRPLWSAASDATYFVDCLDHDCDSEMSARDAAATTEVLLAGYKSAASRQLPLYPSFS